MDSTMTRIIKRPTPKKVKSTLPLLVAHMCLRRAARHVPEVWSLAPAILGIVTPKGMSSLVRDCLKHMAEDSDSDRFYRPEAIFQRFTDASDKDDFPTMIRDYDRVVVVVDDEALLPHSMHLVADAIVRVEAPLVRHLAAAIFMRTGSRPSLEDAFVLATCDLDSVCQAFRPGRTYARAMKVLRLIMSEKAKSAPEEARAVPAAKADGPTLDDLHGLGEAGVWGRDLAQDLADWKAGRITWAEVDRGVLLSGAPGTGKTTYAAALARTCGAHFVSGSYAEWQAFGHMGDMLKAMRRAFADARKHAPSILFIDEIDAFGCRTTGGDEHDRDYSNKVITGFLQELDGVDGREGVVVVGAANHPGELDPAIVRPGRLDRHIVIPLPDAPARHGILRYHLKDSLTGADLSDVVELTEEWTGAMLEQVVRTARRAARRARRDMDVADLLAALPERIPVPAETRWRFAVHEAGHAVAGHVLGFKVQMVEVLETTVIENGHPLGRTFYADRQDLIQTRTLMTAFMIRMLAATAAESEILGEPCSGAGGLPGSDLHSATVLAASMEASLGMGDTVTMVASYEAEDLMRLMRVDALMRRRVDARLDMVMQEARELVRRHRTDVVRVAEALRDRGRLDRAAFLEIVEGQSRLRLVAPE